SSAPRRSRICASLSVSRSSPANRTLPVTRFPRAGSRRMIASEVTDLPQPDSPTRPTVCPGATEKLMPSTAVKGRLLFGPKTTLRSSTSSSGWAEEAGAVGRAVISVTSASGLGVEGLAQRLAHQGEPERHDDDAQGG